jgi:hypothetical protein
MMDTFVAYEGSYSRSHVVLCEGTESTGQLEVAVGRYPQWLDCLGTAADNDGRDKEGVSRRRYVERPWSQSSEEGNNE